MRRSRLLYALISLMSVCIAVAIVLNIYGIGGTMPAHAAKASVQQLFRPADAYTVRPLWQKAVKWNTASGEIPPCLTSAVPPRCYDPQQIRKAYGIQPLLDAGITGKGQTVVLIDGSSSPTIHADVHLYDQLYGLKDPKLNIISPFGPASYDPSAYPETALDVEIVHSLAPDATIDLVLSSTQFTKTPQEFVAALLRATKYAVDHNLGEVISQSFSSGESCVDAAYLQAEHQVFSAARAKGITVLASTGDTGAATDFCSGSVISMGKGVSVPSADPLVTSVGGTTLNATLNTGAYVSETTWNEDNSGFGATGGGISKVFPVPSYQKGIPSLTGRGVPDVAFDADPLTGVPFVLSVGGQTDITPTGGTSISCPSWAAIVLLADQYRGHRLGFLNDTLYSLARSSSYTSYFHDITEGNNTVTLKLQGNPNPVTIPGYSAGPGWDAVTGVGTPKASALVHALATNSLT